jgi:SAM-dependent methyltransferase
VPFDLGGPSPPLLDWLDEARPAPGRAVVPGCGRGHDALELARRGWEATGVDFAPAAIADARAAAARAGLATARFLEQDFFSLGPELDGAYDLLFEQTCYCAIDPRRRDDYARTAERLLRPGGALLFVVFPVDGRAGGPPFNIGLAEVRERFAPAFEVLELAQPRRPSAPGRAGKELRALLRRGG